MNVSSTVPVYRQYKPSPRLREFVEILWVQECGPTPGAPPTTVVPTGRVELIFHYGDSYVQIDGDRRDLMPRCHVVGQQKNPIILDAVGSTGIVIVRFKPWGAFSMFGDALADLNNKIVDLELLWGRRVLDELQEQLGIATTQRERAAIVDAFVVSRLLPPDADRLAVPFVSAINEKWGRGRIDAVAREFNIGRGQFYRRFSRCIGASPKQMSNVVRVQKAIACIRAGGNVHDVVGRCGYADQSHLIHDVVNHSRKRPGELVGVGASSADRFFNSADVSVFCGVTYL